MEYDETQNPQMKMTLPRLTLVELNSFTSHAKRKLATQDDSFCTWLMQVCQDEIDRRNNPGTEASMLVIPLTLRPIELSSFLSGVFLLSRAVLTEPQAAFVDELEMHVICQTACYLQTLDSCWEQVS